MSIIDINNLFPSDIYNIDTMLYNLREKTGVESMIKSDQYFNNIINVSYKSDDYNESINRTLMDVDSFDLNNNAEVPESVNKFQGDSYSEFINVTIQREANVKLSMSDMLFSMNTFLGKTSADVNKTHDGMNKYMRSILQSIGKVLYDKALLNILQTASNKNEPFDESKWNFVNLSESRKIILLESLADVTKLSLCKMVSAKIADDLMFNSLSSTSPEQRKYIPSTYLEDLHIGNFKGPLYYTLRTESIKNFKDIGKIYDKTNINSQNYFIQQAVDLYIKTCYPVILYDYMDCMLELYSQYGDFVNARIALLAKIMFTHYIVKIIGELYSEEGNVTNTNIDLLTQIGSNLTYYIKNINNIDMSYKDTNMMKTIVTDLHATSSKVVNQNTIVQTLKEEIKNNQLSLRNVLANAKDLRKQYVSKIIENIVLICLLIGVLSVCTTLLILQTDNNKFQLIVIYIAGGVAMALLIYYAIVLVVKLIKNSKKSS